MDLTSLPGFRDFYPEQMALRDHVFTVWREVAGRYGFVEYDGPPLEPLDLYVRKSGEEIVGQLYRFTDQGGREVALRPEMTPSFARMVGARAGGMPKPIRWYSIPQLFRYERPQKGRLREHFQLNLDIVGEAGELADAEIIAAAIDMLRAFGLSSEEFVARISDRELIGGLLAAHGVAPEAMGAAFAALDKLDRESPEWVCGRLEEAGVSERSARELLGIPELDLPALLGRVGDDPATLEAGERLRRVFDHLESFGLGAFVRFDPSLVRGLAYYTGTVFELWDRRGEFRAICGGGRYDRLLAAVGGPDLPALGFGMGDVVLSELLKARGLVPEQPAAIQDFVICVTDEQRPAALGVVHALRDRGRRVAYDFAGRSVGRQFKAANQVGAERTIVLGPDELSRGEAVVREMSTGEEKSVPLGSILSD
ncbi:MAG: histidine--tRNA ligase [marine benthic group bacterium]|jgi:histidyl-tRNA synthetase|nr:histidine--tRNA ligase [Gemmatimonadota bacterium]MCL7963001.1 histidine--tRNA ligase [Candidatus Carthagonibacter metallireducens]MCL7938586.1 histidine--tRNA ligase [Gemmatimonadota bacterium]MCL7957552.1 histidine--tRNA ligase [Gemmatimonadota bacterium]MCL7968425.1 histidine--tRNA ligase [Gemmatimonadota bacterium]